MPLTAPATATSALVTVIVPTHDHDETLSWSVRSVLGQTISDLQVVIVGDGVTDEVRDEARQLCRADTRVCFEDHPKTSRRGEILRDRIIRASTSRFVAYNCDDDLWMPDHLATLLEHLGEHHFIHPLPVLVGADGVVMFSASDLGRRDSLDWHLSEVPRNSISLSGVLHTREAYLRLPHGWRETPEGRWTDHYMWQQFFRQEWFSGVTSPRSTTLKLMAQGRDDFPPGGRRADIEHWWNRMHAPGFAEDWDAAVRAAMWRAAVDHRVRVAGLEDDGAHVRRLLASAEARLVEMSAEADRLRTRLAALRRERLALRDSWSWRVTRPLRSLRLLAGRGSQPPR